MIGPVLFGPDRLIEFMSGMYCGGTTCGAFGSTVVVVVGAGAGGAFSVVEVALGGAVVVVSGGTTAVVVVAGGLVVLVVVVVVGLGAVVVVGATVVVGDDGDVCALAARDAPRTRAATSAVSATIGNRRRRTAPSRLLRRVRFA
jgi:hypothetical protein